MNDAQKLKTMQNFCLRLTPSLKMRRTYIESMVNLIGDVKGDVLSSLMLIVAMEWITKTVAVGEDGIDLLLMGK